MEVSVLTTRYTILISGVYIPNLKLKISELLVKVEIRTFLTSNILTSKGGLLVKSGNLFSPILLVLKPKLTQFCDKNPNRQVSNPNNIATLKIRSKIVTFHVSHAATLSETYC